MLHKADKEGKLPLHCACLETGKPETVKFLLDLAPETIHATNSCNNKPLHLGCANKAPTGVIDCLIKAAPQVVLQGGYDDSLPIHFACGESGAPLEVAKLLVNAAPACANAKDANGNRPIHVASCNGASPDIIEFLIEVAPETLMQKGNQGLFHCTWLLEIKPVWKPSRCWLTQNLRLSVCVAPFGTPLEMALQMGAPQEFLSALAVPAQAA